MAGDVSKFIKLCKELSLLAYSQSNYNKLALEQILDGLNSLKPNTPWTESNEKSVLAVNQCCYLIPINEKSLVKKALTFFRTLLTRQNVTIEGKTLHLVVTWCIEVLPVIDPASQLVTLAVLQLLLAEKSNEIEELCVKVLITCTKLMSVTKSDEPPEIYYNSLKCVECIAFSNIKNPLSLVEELINIFLSILYDQNLMRNAYWQQKCYLTALSGLGYSCNLWTNPVIDKLSEVFGVVKGYMLFGLPGQEYVVQKVIPTTVSLPEQLKPSQSVKKLKGKYDKSSKKKSVTPIAEVQKEEETCNLFKGMSLDDSFHLTTSDSEVSDNETTSLRLSRTKVRLSTLSLLGALFQKGDTKILTRYLPSFLPDGTHTPHSRSLLTCLLKDSSPKCRSEVLVILSSILNRFKPYLTLADSLSSSSFTSFSNNIGCTLSDMHKSLILALLSETSQTVTALILKTISNLVRCSPYNKLSSGILTNLAQRTRPFLYKQDVNVKISALTVFGCIASLDVKTSESSTIVLSLDGSNMDGKPWLFKLCMDTIYLTSCNLALAVECLQVIGALVRNYFSEILVPHQTEIVSLLEWGVHREDYQIKLYSAKLMETIVDAIQANLFVEDGQYNLNQLAQYVWSTIIPRSLTTLLQSIEKPALRAIGCEVMVRIGVPNDGQYQGVIFDELPRSHQIVIITQVFGCVSDCDPIVRSSAIRALAVLILIPSLREDPQFYTDTVDAFFKVAADESQAGRVQAAWLFGNLTDSALINSFEGSSSILNDSMTIQLLEHGIRLAQDIPKVKPNAVRGIGNLLHILSPTSVVQHRNQVENGLDVLIKTASSGSLVKARWNSCYALSNAVKNPALCDMVRSKAFPTLCDLLQNYKNFKVRVAAGQALAAFPDRASFGDVYLQAWTAVLTAMENAENLPDFNEYVHRDNLIQTLCLVLCHLLSLVTIPDLTSLDNMLYHHMEFIRTKLERCRTTLVPEKSTLIVNAKDRINNLLSTENLSESHRNSLSGLSAMLIVDE